MTIITTRITVAADGTISVATPLPVGDHAATITVTEPPQRRVSVLDLPTHNGPWDDRLSLRREDLYGDHGL
jgi:hypothetical protein